MKETDYYKLYIDKSKFSTSMHKENIIKELEQVIKELKEL